jgi:hypothetical protein
VRGYKAPKKEVPIFRGNTNDIDDVTKWLASVEVYMTAKFEDDPSDKEVWLTCVSSLLDGEAALWYREEQLKEPFVSWTGFVEKLFLAFTGSGSRMSLLQRLRESKQSKSLSLLDHTARFKQLCAALEKADGKVLDEIKVQYYVESLQPGYATRARQYLMEYPTLHRSESLRRGLSMFDGLVDYLVQWSAMMTPGSAGMNQVSAGPPEKGQKGTKKKRHGQRHNPKCYACGADWHPGHWCQGRRFCPWCGKGPLRERCTCRVKPPQSSLNQVAVCAVGKETQIPTGSYQEGEYSTAAPEIGSATGKKGPESSCAPEQEDSTCQAWTRASESADGLLHHVMADRRISEERAKLAFSFQGSVCGKRVRILMDSGAQDNFVAESFVQAHGIKTVRVSPMSITMADGTANGTWDRAVDRKLVILQEDAPKFVSKVMLRVAPLNNSYDVLLGQPWLEAQDAGLCFKTKGLLLQKARRVLHEEGNCSTMSYRQMVKAWMEAEQEDLLVTVLLQDPPMSSGDRTAVKIAANTITAGESEFHDSVGGLKKKFREIMVDGLPPQAIERKDGVQHTIELLPGSQPVVEPLRGMAPKLLKELRNQISYILKKSITDFWARRMLWPIG